MGVLRAKSSFAAKRVAGQTSKSPFLQKLDQKKVDFDYTETKKNDPY
jgi:hypothetical protein